MREFNKRFNQTQDLEATFELALKNKWSMERAFAELRVTMYITLDLQSSDKTLALQELQEIKDTEENESVLATIYELNQKDAKTSLEMADIWYEVDTLKDGYPDIYKELSQMIPDNIVGNEFSTEMRKLLKQEYREIWKEL